MAEIVGVKFRNSGKLYYFSPEGVEFKEGDGVIVETQRGIEYAYVCQGNSEVPESQIVSPLKPVLRKATKEDNEKQEYNLSLRDNAVLQAVEKVNARSLPMKIVDAEYTFDCSKIIFYFTADNRVDFRELVKDLASVFRIRIELRQIYERDDIKMRGALASCGRPCCCVTHLQDFEKVTIKMAKIQGLSLNPTKISGCCGKLMCCLKYENAYYSEMFKKMPKVKSQVTVDGITGIVESNDIIKQLVKVKFTGDDGSIEFKIYPLSKVNAKFHQTEEDVGGEEITEE